MDAEAYQDAVNELYEAMNGVFLANSRLYAAAHIVWNWEANEMPSVILEELNESGRVVPMEVVEEEAVAETMRKKWERSWDGTIEAWLEARAQRREALSAQAAAVHAQSAPMSDSFFNSNA